MPSVSSIALPSVAGQSVHSVDDLMSAVHGLAGRQPLDRIGISWLNAGLAALAVGAGVLPAHVDVRKVVPAVVTGPTVK